jgi:hypothetical protein
MVGRRGEEIGDVGGYASAIPEWKKMWQPDILEGVRHEFG